LQRGGRFGQIAGFGNRSERDLLKFVKLNSVETMRTRLANTARRRVLGSAGRASILLVTTAILTGAASAQIAAPRYQSPLEAPKPQPAGIPAPTPIGPDATVVEYPVARVNNRLIDNSDYLRGQRDLMEEQQRNNTPPAEMEVQQKNLLRDMIDTQLLLSRGTELGINVDSEVIRQLDDIRKGNHMDSMEDLEKAVRQEGLSYEDFKANIKNHIIQQEVIGQEVGRKLSLTAKQEQAYYDAHKQEFVQPESVRLSEILIPTPEGATDAQIAQAQAKANEVIGKLKAGAKFEDLVKQYSGGPNADKGGDLGSYPKGQLPKVLEDQTFALQPGQWTAPIQTRQGFVIEEVTEHAPGGVPPLSAVEQQVEAAIYKEAIDPALRAYLTDLREKAYIYIEPGFVDTGASPRETKSVYVGATPPPVKKKTAKKARLEASRAAAAAAKAAKASAAAATPPPTANSLAPVKLTKSGKVKKPKREKIRFGQAPQNSLPSSPEETTVTVGADQGPGAHSSMLPGPAIGAAMASTDPTPSASDSDADPFAAAAPAKGKTRYSDRAPMEKKMKAEAKAAKIKQKVAATPAPMSAEEKTTQQLQRAPLQTPADTGKKKKVKGAPKERIQAKPPAPPAPKPEAHPIPPKSVRDNGEPVVTPPPNPSTLPPVTAPPAGSSVDTTPATPANPAPNATPPQQ
jgi:peptidyl-prolyl cis-trans isomerase SurA